MAVEQKERFLESEGDAWFERNARPFDRASDPVLAAVADLGLHPRSILEIGCGRGDRLEAMRRDYGAQCAGIDPSGKAVAYAKANFSGIRVGRGTAATLEFPAASFDLVVFGFCLYLCDPRDHFLIASEADRVLADDGFLAIYDFSAPTAYSNEYKHAPGLKAYKMQWSDLFTRHPSYRLLARRYREHGKPYGFAVDESVTVDILRKDVAAAFPQRC